MKPIQMTGIGIVLLVLAGCDDSEKAGVANGTVAVTPLTPASGGTSGGAPSVTTPAGGATHEPASSGGTSSGGSSSIVTASGGSAGGDTVGGATAGSGGAGPAQAQPVLCRAGSDPAEPGLPATDTHPDCLKPSVAAAPAECAKHGHFYSEWLKACVETCMQPPFQLAGGICKGNGGGGGGPGTCSSPNGQKRCFNGHCYCS